MSGIPPIPALQQVADAFAALGVDYYIGGSIATGIYGNPRQTQDVDLVADLRHQHVLPLVRMLESDFYVSEPAIRDALERQSAFNLIHNPTSFKVDVFLLKDRAFDEKEMTRVVRAAPFDHDDREYPFSSLEGVILNKLLWFRETGETSENQWMDVQKVLRVQRGQINQDYLKEWARDLRVSDLVQRALDEIA